MGNNLSLTESNFVVIAEETMKKLAEDNERNRSNLTTSQLRNILAALSPIYDELRVRKEEKLTRDIIGKINYAKVQIAYAAGREKTVKDFVTKARLLECIDQIDGKRSQFILFERYVEALVAYHKFYGGKEN